jgi:small-conductance mechanosensitive channel
VGAWLGGLPEPTGSVALTVTTLVVSYGIGHLLRVVAVSRLSALTRRTRGEWDDIVVQEISRRVPFWTLLLGVEVSTGFWTLPPHILDAAQRGLLALAVTSLTLAAAAAASRLIERRENRNGRTLPLTGLTRLVLRGAIVGVGFLMVLNGLGVSITPILTALGVGGLAVALALQDTLSNLFAGLYIIAAGQVRLGDYVRLDSGQEGYVTDIGWRSTKIRMLANNLVLVPNAKLAQAMITNFDLPERDLAVLVDVGVDYASDLDHVERVTVDVAREVLRTVEGGVSAFEPFIRYHTFGDSSIQFTVILRGSQYVSQYALKHEFIKRLHRRYAAEGISIPFPMRTLVVRQAEPAATIERGVPLS